jgi:hypothetical protein
VSSDALVVRLLMLHRLYVNNANIFHLKVIVCYNAQPTHTLIKALEKPYANTARATYANNPWTSIYPQKSQTKENPSNIKSLSLQDYKIT